VSLVSHRAAAVQAAHWAAFRRTYNGTATGIGPESFGYFDAAGNAKGWTYVSPGRREFCECLSSWTVTHRWLTKHMGSDNEHGYFLGSPG
jgi:hypothetical protein